jgi:hypothetical protein
MSAGGKWITVWHKTDSDNEPSGSCHASVGAEFAVPHINDELRMLVRKQSHRAMQIRGKVHGQSASVVSQGAIRKRL